MTSKKNRRKPRTISQLSDIAILMKDLFDVLHARTTGDLEFGYDWNADAFKLEGWDDSWAIDIRLQIPLKGKSVEECARILFKWVINYKPVLMEREEPVFTEQEEPEEQEEW